MNKLITMTAYRRPEYTGQVLDALARCEGVEDWRLAAFIEPGPQEVMDAFLKFSACPVEIHHNVKRLGLNRNAYQALWHARDYDAVLHLEDDTLLAPDALTYYDWALQHFADAKNIFTVAGYNKVDTAPPRSSWHEVDYRKWFTCWAWATWRNRLCEMIGGWSFGNPRSFAWHLNSVVRDNRMEVFPRLSRVQNIGLENGENKRSVAWYREHHYTPAFAGDFSVPRGEFGV